MLYYDKKQGEVKVKDAFEQHKAVKKLKSVDRQKEKKYFQKVITYAYYMFNQQDGYLSIENLRDRHNEVIQSFNVFDPVSDKDINEKKSLQDFCYSYKKYEWIQEEKDYEKLAQKIQKMIDYIIEFDDTIKTTVEFDVPYEFEDENGNKHEGAKKVKKTIEYIDTAQVSKLTKSLSDLYEQKDKLKKQMVKAQYNKNSDKGRTLFDRTDIKV